MSKIQFTPLNQTNYERGQNWLNQLTYMINDEAVACG